MRTKNQERAALDVVQYRRTEFVAWEYRDGDGLACGWGVDCPSHGDWIIDDVDLGEVAAQLAAAELNLEANWRNWTELSEVFDQCRRVPTFVADACRIAVEFADMLAEELTAYEFYMVREYARRNPNDGACASHDYVDANETMLTAFESALGRDMRMSYRMISPNDESARALVEHDDNLWSRAWEIAKRHGFKTSYGA